MIATMLRDHGLRVLHNRAGANLVSGLTSTVLTESTIWGQLHADIGLFETDEAALPQALAETLPRLVVLHNLFRDQLDRYGEVDTIASNWSTALRALPASSTVLLNAMIRRLPILVSNSLLVCSTTGWMMLAMPVALHAIPPTHTSVAAAAHVISTPWCFTATLGTTTAPRVGISVQPPISSWPVSIRTAPRAASCT